MRNLSVKEHVYFKSNDAIHCKLLFALVIYLDPFIYSNYLDPEF